MAVEKKHNLEVCCERVYLRNQPSTIAAIDTELFFGTPVTLLKREGEWHHIRSTLDGYEGYVEKGSLAPLASLVVNLADHSTKEFVVVVPLALGYREAKDTATSAFAFPMGSRLCVSEPQEAGGSFVALRLKARQGEQVFVKRHKLIGLAECGIANGRDWVSTALKFLNVPYLYGGGCYAGIDCSALLQVSMGVHGMVCPRDSALQERDLGEALDWTGQGGRNPGGKNPLPILRRGDLVFWHRHVGVMVDGEELLHANAGSMAVSRESLAGARARIMGVEGEVSCIRRLSR